MALTADRKIEALAPHFRVKTSAPSDSGTYYAGEILIAAPESNTVKPISGSSESGVQVCGIVTKQQTVAQGETLEFEYGLFVLSGSGFTNDEVGKIAYSDSSTAVYDAHSAGYHAIGRFKGFIGGSSTVNNCIIDVGAVRSGTSL